MVVIGLDFVDHISPVIAVAKAILAQGIAPDDVPTVPTNLVSQIQIAKGEATFTVMLLPSPELCEWLGALTHAADRRLSKRRQA